MYKKKKLFFNHKNKIIIFTLFLSTVCVYFLIDMNIKNLCKDIPKVINSIRSLGLSTITECKEPLGIKKYLKVKSPRLHEIGSYIKWKYISKHKYNKNKTNFNKIKKDEYIKLQKKYFPDFFSKDLYITGLINNPIKSNSKGFTYKESKNSYRQNKDNINSKFYNNDKIKIHNINRLKLLWKYKDIPNEKLEKKWIENIEISPIYAEGKIFYISAKHKLYAMNVENGKIIWSKQLLHNPARRGFLWNKQHIYLPTGSKIYKLDANNGKLIKNFGFNGYISTNSSIKFSPIIFKDNIYIVNYHGVLMKHNKISGEKIFEINLLPKKNFWGGVPWGGMALDEVNNIIYVVTGNPRPGTYGVKRIGSNKNSNSIIAVDLNKRKIIWTFQETSHDLWDLDIAFPPILITIKINNINYDCVVVATKVGNLILLERLTGKPIFDMMYKKAPISNVPGEITSPYQLFIEKPQPMTKFEFSLNDVENVDVNQKKYLLKKLKKFEYGWFKPPSMNVPLIYMANGPIWEGGSINPINKKFYTTVNHLGTVIKMNPKSTWPHHTKFKNNYKEIYKTYINKCSSCHGKNREGFSNVRAGIKISGKKNVPSLVGYYLYEGLQKKINNYDQFSSDHKELKLDKKNFINLNKLFKYWDKSLKEKNLLTVQYQFAGFENEDKSPGINYPHGEIVAYDLQTGLIDWRVPFGKVKKNGKILSLGSHNKGGLATTVNDIIFATGTTTDNRIVALNAKNGEEIWSYEMDAAGSAPPIIYSYKDKDYMSVISTGHLTSLQADASAKKEALSKDSVIYTFRLD